MNTMDGRMRMPEMTDATLLRYIDGESSSSEKEMIEGSEELSSRANELASEQKRYSRAMFRAECPDSLILGEYHLNLLTNRERTPVELHVNECPVCTNELAEMSAFVGAAPKVKLKEMLERGRQIVAELVEGSLGDPELAPRGFGGGTRLYMAEDLQLSISVQPDAKDDRRKSITGLAVGGETHGMVAHLVHDGESVQIADVDDLGNFHFEGIDAGLFDVLISGEDVVVKIGFIQI